MKVPVVGEVYDHFDDGKIRESRRSDVIIIAVIPFVVAQQVDKDLWKQEVHDANFLYAPQTDYLVYGDCSEEDVLIVYARTHDGGWFSLGWFAGRLLDKQVWEEMKKHER